MLQRCLDSPVPRNKPLSAKYMRGYAFPVIKNRVPEIVNKIMNQLAEEEEAIVAKHGEGAREDVKNVLTKLSALRDELSANKTFRDIISDKPDAEIWRAERIKKSLPDGTLPNWFESDWLYVECYLYRRIIEPFEQSTYLQDHDPYRAWKVESFIQSIPAIISLGRHLDSILKKLDSLAQEDIQKFLNLYLKASMWSNRCDLALTDGKAVGPDGSIIEQAVKLDKCILVDKTQLIWDTLSQKKDNKILDIVMDNAGYELFTDLVLADYLISSKLVNKIRFHPKLYPWFISDVTFWDFDYVLDAVANDLEDSSLNNLGKKWRSYVNSGIWTLEVEPFWTYCHSYQVLKEQDPKLYSKLGEAILVIFKGDLNYRKLMGDILWDPTTPFHAALQGFHPTNIASLRTVKSETVTNLEPGVAENLTSIKSEWLLTGEYATIQFSPFTE